ncbi:hypothetical protein SUGI_0263850 [Cryptomeria japonica]|uniref:ATPase family AAA domain-containing protein FIGL1 n=1 Tax=Cryptomeria japonica TaxID=3369 RepID=UPI0024089538|nr:ATPase family AAA domain-containing protein FIGL1 [Cryptomeria japonica]GLJ15958.1 hypothetical protein SUGI_0263850 [Cryptomeria japonica]
MGADTPQCWREEVDSKLKRLHSLKFGAERALETGDGQTALGLALRLIGFLESQCGNTDHTDEIYINPIRKDAYAKVRAARQILEADSDSRAFEQARCKKDFIFSNRGSIDIEMIKQSRFFKPLIDKESTPSKDKLGCLSPNNPNLATSHCPNLPRRSLLHQPKGVDYQPAKSSSTTPKQLTQAKITSLYGIEVSKPAETLLKGDAVSTQSNSFQELVQKQTTLSNRLNCQKTSNATSPLQIDDEDTANENIIKRKRRHLEALNQMHENGRPTLNGEGIEDDVAATGFVTARLKLAMDNMQKRGASCSPNSSFSATVNPGNPNNCNGGSSLRTNVPKTLGVPRRGVRNNFIPPVRYNAAAGGANVTSRSPVNGDNGLEESTKKCLEMLVGPDGELPDKLRNLEPRLIEHVSNEIMDQDPNVRWDDIAGLEHAKKCVTEMVIWPLLRPDIFQGCRSPGKGLLLFGPPGTGKTMIGKAIAGEAKATFFYISASSLTSKWIGEGEKLVRALFGVASCRQPAVIFVDEIDSLLSQRKSEGEHESSRRLKTQFLIEMEGFDSGNEQLLLIGATNRPQELDEAARRRLTKRLYIPLPSTEARSWIIRNVLDKDGLFNLSDEELNSVCKITDGYSGSDMKNLVKDASMGPLREALRKGIDIANLRKEDMRPVTLQDFQKALQEVRPSVSQNELGIYEEWNQQFGSLSL